MREILKHRGAKVKLSDSDIVNILDFLALGESTEVLAKQYGVQKVMIDNVLNGCGRFKFLLATPKYENMILERKKNVTEIKHSKPSRKRKHNHNKLTSFDWETLHMIKNEYESGEKIVNIAKKHNIAFITMYRFLKGQWSKKLKKYLEKINFIENKTQENNSSIKIMEKLTSEENKPLFQKVYENNCVFGNKLLEYVETSDNFKMDELYSNDTVTIIIMAEICQMTPYELKMYLTQLKGN